MTTRQRIQWMAVMASVVCVLTVFGVDKTWQGASGGKWTTGGNWAGGAAPANSESETMIRRVS